MSIVTLFCHFYARNSRSWKVIQPGGRGKQVDYLTNDHDCKGRQWTVSIIERKNPGAAVHWALAFFLLCCDKASWSTCGNGNTYLAQLEVVRLAAKYPIEASSCVLDRVFRIHQAVFNWCRCKQSIIELQVYIQGSAGKQIRYLIGAYAHDIEPGDGKIKRKGKRL